MARLEHIIDLLVEEHQVNVQIRRNLRRMARYQNNAFDMNDEEFRQNYRVNKSVFDMIYQDLYPVMRPITRRSDISVKFKVCKRFYTWVSKFHM